MPPTTPRLPILKTYKLFIGGRFPRTESGRTLSANAVKSGTPIAQYCHASRKDLRDAVSAARAAFPSWSEKTSAYLRAQILYRCAEMLESRAASIASELALNAGIPEKAALAEVHEACDRLVHFAGWCDKFTQVFSSVNPVASPHFSFSSPEPTGVVGVLCPDTPGLLPLVSLMAETVLSGNTVVLLASETTPLPALALAEVVATSDVPGGVINILTGNRAELAPTFATHMDINALVDASADPSVAKTLQAGRAENLKRVTTRALAEKDWFSDAARDPFAIADTTELKTAWHPAGV